MSNFKATDTYRTTVAENVWFCNVSEKDRLADLRKY